MNRYYTKKGELLGVAWSTMNCWGTKTPEDHKPHVHNPEHTFYGPYMCRGYPERKIYNQPKRKPV